MQIDSLLNSTIVSIDNRMYFVDSGFKSFTVTGKTRSAIPSDFSGLPSDYPILNSMPHQFVQGLETMMGCTFHGFLGADFLTQRPIRICHQQRIMNFDDRPSGEPNFILNMPRPWAVEIQIDGRTLSAFIDTGSMFTFRWDIRSNGGGTTWVIPTAFGDAQLHIFPTTGISTNGQFLANVVTGHIEGVPKPPFDVILGANFLCQFDCYFDFANRQLLLFKQHFESEAVHGIDSDRMSCGFQFQFRTGKNELELFVSNHTHPNVLIPIGTSFSIPGLPTNSDHTDAIFNTLYPKEKTHIVIETSDGLQEIPTHPFCFGTHNIHQLR